LSIEQKAEVAYDALGLLADQLAERRAVRLKREG